MIQSANRGLGATPGELHPALARYVEEARTSPDVVAIETRATQAVLRERATTWLAVEKRCQEEVAELTGALHRCTSADDPASDAIERALREALIRLRASQEEFASVRRWAQMLSGASPS